MPLILEARIRDDKGRKLAADEILRARTACRQSRIAVRPNVRLLPQRDCLHHAGVVQSRRVDSSKLLPQDGLAP